MPCAAGVHCGLQHDTPDPPNFTCHKCRNCKRYLHSICGVPDLLGSSEMNRVCKVCSGSAEPPVPTSNGAALTLKRAVLTSVSTKCKPRGATKRTRLSTEQKVEALDYLQSKRAKITTAAAKEWVSLEDDQNFVAALRLDAQDDILKNALEKDKDDVQASSDDGVGNSAGSSYGDPDIVPAPPPYSEVAELFGGLEAVAEKSCMRDFSFSVGRNWHG